MIELKQTATFRKWFDKLRDERAITAILLRLARLAYGHAGDAEPIGKAVSELRIHYGPGYRVYFKRRGDTIIVLLCGGDKGSQARDIKTALRLADEWNDNDD
jgi:putative addiction module killer protein